MAYHIMYSKECPTCTCKECIFYYCWMKCFINVCKVHLVYCMTEVQHFLVAFIQMIYPLLKVGLLKSFAIIVLLSVSPFRSVIIFLKYLGIPMLYIIFIPSWQMIPRYHFWLKVYFVWYKYSSLAFFWLLLKWNIFLYPLEPMYVLKSVSYRQHIVAWNFFSQQTE